MHEKLHLNVTHFSHLSLLCECVEKPSKSEKLFASVHVIIKLLAHTKDTLIHQQLIKPKVTIMAKQISQSCQRNIIIL